MPGTGYHCINVIQLLVSLIALNVGVCLYDMWPRGESYRSIPADTVKLESMDINSTDQFVVDGKIVMVRLPDRYSTSRLTPSLLNLGALMFFAMLAYHSRRSKRAGGTKATVET